MLIGVRNRPKVWRMPIATQTISAAKASTVASGRWGIGAAVVVMGGMLTF
jgi:hypothetical protein